MFTIIKILKSKKKDLNELTDLGSGDYVLESLYLKSHNNNPNREPINTRRVDENTDKLL